MDILVVLAVSSTIGGFVQNFLEANFKCISNILSFLMLF
jgi:hypothetical protein